MGSAAHGAQAALTASPLQVQSISQIEKFLSSFRGLLSRRENIASGVTAGKFCHFF
jgi:hypothetical protein